MTTCSKCGAQYEGKFCPECGASADSFDTMGTQGQPAGGPPPAAGASGGMDANVAGTICYVLTWLTGLIFLLLEPYKNDKKIRFHAFQAIFFGVGITVLAIVVTVVSTIVGIALGATLGGVIASIVGLVFTLLSLVIWVGGLIVWILLMVKTYQGQKWVLPFIGPMAEKYA